LTICSSFNRKRFPAAAAAAIVVGVVGLLVARQLSEIPENSMKLAVGVMLTSFGTFWAAEGAGANWPGDDASLLGVLVFVIAASAALVALLRRQRVVSAPLGAEA